MPQRSKPQKKITFPFQARESELLGELKRPLVTVSLWSETLQKWRQVEMLVDTGADYTVLPSYLAALLEIDLDTLKKVPASGLGGKHELYFVPSLGIKIGEMERSIPVGFIRQRSFPPLLGRAGCFETFHSVFEFDQALTLSE